MSRPAHAWPAMEKHTHSKQQRLAGIVTYSVLMHCVGRPCPREPSDDRSLGWHGREGLGEGL